VSVFILPLSMKLIDMETGVVEAVATLLSFFREAWIALTGALLAFALLSMLAQILKVSSASVLGANLWVWEAVSAIIAVLMLVLFGFVGVPHIIRAVETVIPSTAGCGPISELGGLSAIIIGGLAGLRMLKAVFTAVLSASLGGQASMSDALIESAEALFGMLLAAAAIPVAAWFLGAC
jgi:hypothetical protein